MNEIIVGGVISANNIAWECIDNEICLDCEKIEKEIRECEVCPECGGDLLQIRPDYIECEECLTEYDMDGAFEMVECNDHEKLIGDWLRLVDAKTGEVEYEPDIENGEFAAIVTSSTFNCVQVVWSKYITEVHAMCSPCFPNQADLDSGKGNIKCYDLPDYLIEQ